MADEYITKERAKVAFDDSLRLSTKEWNMVFEGIDALPAADVAPVRHGRWGHRWVCSNMTGYEYACSCSECGKPTYRISTLEDMPPYCPNCGAKMDGGDKSERQAMAVQSQND